MKTSTLEVFVLCHKRARYITHLVDSVTSLPTRFWEDSVITFAADRFSYRNALIAAARLRFSGIRSRVTYDVTYREKITRLARSNSSFVMKIDEDIYISADGMQKFITNAMRGLRESPESLYTLPLSTGIPTVELFIERMNSQHVANEIRKIFASVRFERHWGVDYSKLNGVYGLTGGPSFAAEVKLRIEHYYKGIHPVRMSSLAQKSIVDWVLKDSGWKMPAPVPDVEFTSVYFCNSCFVASSSFYRATVLGMEKAYYIDDGFDEVALNQHLASTGGSLVVVGCSLGIHPSYNSVADYCDISDAFFDSLP